MTTLGARIRSLRESRGFSRPALAQMSGVSERAIQNLELGQADPRVGTLEKIAVALGVKVEELVKK
ncbi:MAG: helix-turn-helix domain-containing protein [Dehalococcoidia bacterium]|jgi:transcriptional regulator with XRE-family HTH domain